MENIEIEIQIKIENSKPLLEFLKKNGKFIFENHQIDEYFSPAHRDFTAVRPINEWFRLRDSDGKYSITYKNWHTDKEGKSDYCDEYESEIESLKSLKKILGALNFKSLVVVDKVRKTWKYKNFEFAIDSVKRLDDFVEIEYIGNEKKVNPKEVTKEMINFIKEVGCGKIERNYVGYPFLLLFKEEAKWEGQ